MGCADWRKYRKRLSSNFKSLYEKSQSKAGALSLGHLAVRAMTCPRSKSGLLLSWFARMAKRDLPESEFG
jgi:hypothetical protein